MPPQSFSQLRVRSIRHCPKLDYPGETQAAPHRRRDIFSRRDHHREIVANAGVAELNMIPAFADQRDLHAERREQV